MKTLLAATATVALAATVHAMMRVAAGHAAYEARLNALYDAREALINAPNLYPVGHIMDDLIEQAA